MVRRSAIFLAVTGLFALFVAPAGAGSLPFAAEVAGVTFEVAATPQAAATLAACQQITAELGRRGWRADALRVQIQADRYDATAAANLVLAAAADPLDNAFLLAREIVIRSLPRATVPELGRALAEVVAAHSVPAGTPARNAWESEWLARLLGGDVATTALPELLWRTGGDEAVRLAASGRWPERALSVLDGMGVGDVRSALGDVVVAALLRPAALGFAAPAPVLARSAAVGSGRVEMSSPAFALRIAPVDVTAHAVTVRAARVAGAALWCLVRYAQDEGFEVVALTDGGETVLPGSGVAWAGVAAIGFEVDSRVEVDLTPREDYPIVLDRWDFQATEGSVVLTWETGRHENLQGFVVETLVTAGAENVRVRSRSLVPVSDEEMVGQGYTFVDEASRDVVGYRLLAVTGDGLVAEVGVFPLAGVDGD